MGRAITAEGYPFSPRETYPPSITRATCSANKVNLVCLHSLFLQSACQVVPLPSVPTISITAWSLEMYITDESSSPEAPLHTFPEHEVPLFPAWHVLMLLAGWLRACMVDSTHFDRLTSLMLGVPAPGHPGLSVQWR